MRYSLPILAYISAYLILFDYIKLLFHSLKRLFRTWKHTPFLLNLKHYHLSVDNYVSYFTEPSDVTYSISQYKLHYVCLCHTCPSSTKANSSTKAKCAWISILSLPALSWGLYTADHSLRYKFNLSLTTRNVSAMKTAPLSILFATTLLMPST